jgi:hypothetical protein
MFKYLEALFECSIVVAGGGVLPCRYARVGRRPAAPGARDWPGLRARRVLRPARQWCVPFDLKHFDFLNLETRPRRHMPSISSVNCALNLLPDCLCNYMWMLRLINII